MATVELRHIKKVYPNGVNAVKDFSLEIEDGEFVVFVGPSGCGKSTVLRMIAGLEEITDGELIINGKVMNEEQPIDRNISMVFQNYALYPHLTVRQNIAFPLKVAKIPFSKYFDFKYRKERNKEINQIVEDVASKINLTEYLDRKPKNLSGGQRQRVALGRAIVRHPVAFLLDEPLSNLDAKMRTQMRTEISKLHNDLKSIFIYVTHDQVEAMTMGSKIVVMKDGIIQQIATPGELFMHPVNKFVAGFIGTPQMNFINSTITKENDKVFLSVPGNENKLELPENLVNEKVLSYVGKEVILGVRPKAVSVSEDGILDAKVTISEQLGDEALVYFNFNGEKTEFVSSMQTYRKYDPDTLIKVNINLEHACLFDKESEESII